MGGVLVATSKKKRHKPGYNLGEACFECGHPLNRVVGMSRSYLQCRNDHTAARRQICELGSCRKVARQTGWSADKGNWASCNDHVNEVSGFWY